MYPAKCNFLRDSKIILVIFAPAYYQVNVTNTLLKESGQKIMFSIKNSDNTRVRVFSEILQLGAEFSIFFLKNQIVLSNTIQLNYKTQDSFISFRYMSG